ncbi:hypothetical protein O6H91_03G034500 [Diphasiastrum complanatum]|uniref:Uncharacterized protein n=2 Tax=Diphasiastrum complanatum TaxID=34168 RepID=A0ACC2E3Z3_DIPCM|nr:hypothetical protein O6H91_03G014400 [Diphasiastrum complanatum]KAJ7561589.1 hypothetical protein O6H91_03G034500 [Diphasiastrum complanatum]
MGLPAKGQRPLEKMVDKAHSLSKKDEVVDSAELRLNELGYKQELRREMTLFKTLAISFSTMTLFTGITPLYGSSLAYAGPAGLVWGWIIVSFFTFFVGIAMSEICSSFPTTGSLYFWAAHLAGPKWGPFSSWCCAWLEAIGLIAGIGTQAYAGAQTLQNIILLSTGTAKDGRGYFAPREVFLCMYIALTLIWAILNTFALNVIAVIDIISIWWQVIGGAIIVIVLPWVAPTTQSASYVFWHFETSPSITGIHSVVYCFVLSLLVSQFSLFGYDAAAHLTEETKGAEKNGPIAILSSIALISLIGWAYILALTFSIQDPKYLFDVGNETAGSFVPAQILYDAFHGRYHSSAGAIVFLFIIWGSFFFGGLSITTSAARVVYALSRDGGFPFSRIWRVVHPRYKVPANAVWICSFFCILIGLPILKLNVVFTAITSVCTIGWVGGYAVPIFARMIMPPENFKPGPFYLGKASPYICLVAFLWICYTCSVFLLPTQYPLQWGTFNYAPVALGFVLTAIMLWWFLDARKWFKGPVRNVDNEV